MLSARSSWAGAREGEEDQEDVTLSLLEVEGNYAAASAPPPTTASSTNTGGRGGFSLQFLLLVSALVALAAAAVTTVAWRGYQQQDQPLSARPAMIGELAVCPPCSEQIPCAEPAQPVAVTPAVVDPSVGCANATAGSELVRVDRLRAEAHQAEQRLRAIRAQEWYCRLDSWILGEWTPDGHTFLPNTLVATEEQGRQRINLPQGDPKFQYHIHTPQEARDCLRNRPLALIGPSYLRDVMTTLRDLLHGKPLRRGWHNMNPEPIDHELLGPGFDRLELITANGIWRGWTVIEEALPRYRGQTVIFDNLIWDVNTAAIELHFGSRETAFEVYFLNLRRFLTLCRRYDIQLIFMTQMSLEHGKGLSTAPVQYRAAQTDDVFQSLLDRTIPLLEEFDYPWLDVFHMTGNCVTDPTETDPAQPCNASSHSNWYVSMMKVHILLNYLCRDCAQARARLPPRPISQRRLQEMRNGTVLTMPTQWV